MSNDQVLESSLQNLLDLSWIIEVLHPVKSGKEATVYCCRAHPSLGCEFVAAKVYRPREHRTFKNDAAYQEGRWRRENRAARAFRNKSEFGREVQAGAWIEQEWETLRALHRAGVSVPRPLRRAGSVLLMEFLGEESMAAPCLQSVRLDASEAGPALAALLADIERMLSVNVVHGDLSAFNILWAGGRPRIIDLPQAVDPRFNPNARTLLTRDLENVDRAFARYGAASVPYGHACSLWTRFEEGRL